MAKSKYTKRRRFIQGLALVVLASIPLRLLCVDLEGECIRFFGARFGLATMFYPLFAIVALLMVVVFLSMRKGRIFCSHLCPMHMLLEIVNGPASKTSSPRAARVWLWSVLASVFLTEVILSFFQPMGRQIDLAAAGNFPLIGVASALLLGFMVLFVHYREQFCKRGCPYALIQMLLQTDTARYMEFANPEKTCTNCRRCDDICPFNLRARFESRGHDCTNCNLCFDACTDELGEGHSLFRFVDSAQQGSAAH